MLNVFSVVAGHCHPALRSDRSGKGPGMLMSMSVAAGTLWGSEDRALKDEECHKWSGSLCPARGAVLGQM